MNLSGVDFESDVEWNVDVELCPNDDDLVEASFEHVFSHMKGHAKVIDECHSSLNPPYCGSDNHETIVFHQQDHVDQCYLAKTRYLIIIVSVSEVQYGIENLSLRGRSSGRLNNLNFGRCAGRNYFKSFVSAAPYCFADDKW